MKNKLEEILKNLKRLATFTPSVSEDGIIMMDQDYDSSGPWVEKESVQKIIQALEDLLNSEEFYDYNNRGEVF